MMKSQIFERITFIFILICLTVFTTAYAQDLGLVDLLSSQLGITKDQASGGAGSIFQLAKQNLNGEDFSSVAKAVPGIDKMMGMAPKVEESSSTLGRISSMFGSSSKKVGGIAGLTSSFEKLGLSGNMVDKFIPIILDYVNKNGGEKVMSLLKGALL